MGKYTVQRDQTRETKAAHPRLATASMGRTRANMTAPQMPQDPVAGSAKSPMGVARDNLGWGDGPGGFGKSGGAQRSPGAPGSMSTYRRK